MFKLNGIKVGMKYQYVRNEIIKSENLIMTCLPAFCGSDYDIVKILIQKKRFMY